MNTLSTITILPGTKEEISIYCQNAKNEILAGDYDPLLILKQLKAMETVLKNLLSDEEIKKSFKKEAEKYDKTFNHLGVEFQLKNLPAQYNYENCNDSELILLQQEFEMKKSQLKAREKFLQGLKNNYINQDTGEVILPPAKSQGTVVSVTFK